jgi:hypothetical protein
MLIEISNPRLLQDLLDFLRRAECVAEQTGRNRLEVYVPRAPTEEAGRREVELYLATWRARHPGVGTDLID